jgi:hypothetical protein
MQAQMAVQTGDCCRGWLDHLERHGPLHNATELRACGCGRRFYVQFACVSIANAWSCNVVDAVPEPRVRRRA